MPPPIFKALSRKPAVLLLYKRPKPSTDKKPVTAAAAPACSTGERWMLLRLRIREATVAASTELTSSVPRSVGEALAELDKTNDPISAEQRLTGREGSRPMVSVRSMEPVIRGVR